MFYYRYVLLSLHLLSFCDLFSHIFRFPLVAVGFPGKEVGEKQPSENQEKHHQFHRDNRPKCAPHGHTAKTIAVEPKHPYE